MNDDQAPEALIFDKENMMDRLMYDEGLAKMVAQAILEDIPRYVEALRGHLTAGDARGAVREVHTIRGAAANVCGERLMAVAAAMEKAGKAGNLAALSARLADLETQFDVLKEAMRKETW